MNNLERSFLYCLLTLFTIGVIVYYKDYSNLGIFYIIISQFIIIPFSFGIDKGETK